ncbi:MAG TPA: hypothetical protein PK289_12630, partial [Bacteroidia bacterium]|nr:hypothetical protein [Bacteroidia bacterium]
MTPVLLSGVLLAQQRSTHLQENVKTFTEKFLNIDTRSGKNTITVPVSNAIAFEIEVNINNNEEGDYKVVGGVKGYEQSTFAFYGNEKAIEGHILFLKTKEAYDLSTDKSGNVVFAPTDITKIIGWDEYNYTDEERVPQREYTSEEILEAQKTMAIPQHESMPGAAGVLYLDFDGEVSKSEWNGGNTINAAALNWATQNPQNIT